VDPDSFGDGLINGLARVQRARRVLEDQLYLPPVRLERSRAVAQGRPLIGDLAGRWLLEAEEGAREGRLPAARLTGQGHDLARHHLEVDAVYRVRILPAAQAAPGEGHVQLAYLDDGWAGPVGARSLRRDGRLTNVRLIGGGRTGKRRHGRRDRWHGLRAGSGLLVTRRRPEVVAHANALSWSRTSTQAARCPLSTGQSSTSTVEHSSRATGQRGWNVHPDGRSSGCGGSPPSPLGAYLNRWSPIVGNAAASAPGMK
jgi:hypothetical protein